MLEISQISNNDSYKPYLNGLMYNIALFLQDVIKTLQHPLISFDINKTKYDCFQDMSYSEIMSTLKSYLHKNNITDRQDLKTRTKFDEYVYAGLSERELNFDSLTTYGYFTYIWFIEKYLISTDKIIKERTPLYLGARRNLHGEQKANQLAKVELKKILLELKKYNIYLNKRDEAKWLKNIKNHFYELPADFWIEEYLLKYISYGRSAKAESKIKISKDSIVIELPKRLKEIGISEIETEHSEANNRNWSEQIKLLSYLYSLEHSNLLRSDSRQYALHDFLITEVLKDENLKSGNFTYFYDVYEKMIYDISLALEFDFLADVYIKLNESIREWNKIMAEISSLIGAMTIKNLNKLSDELSKGIKEILNANYDTLTDNNSVLERFYSRLIINKEIFNCHKSLKSLKKIDSVIIPEQAFRPDNIFFSEGQCINYPLDIKSDSAIQETSKYVDEHIESITTFVYGKDDATKRKQVRRRTNSIHNILVMLQQYYNVSYISEYMVYLAYKEYNSLRQVEFKDLYPTNRNGVPSAFHEIAKNNVSATNATILLNMIDKRRSAYFEYDNNAVRIKSEISMLEFLLSLLETRNIETISSEINSRANQMQKFINGFKQKYKIISNPFSIIRANPEF